MEKAEIRFVGCPNVPESICPEHVIKSMDDSTAAKLNAVLLAVAEGPPHKFRGGGYWEAMHGEMSGFHEIRILGKRNRLFRVICLSKRNLNTQEQIVVLAILQKSKGEKISTREYAKVKEIADSFRSD